ncbi:phage tail tape measure protein, partial [Ursidibacter sp. B-7004-1]
MANNLAIGLVIGASLSSNFKTAFSGANATLEKLSKAVEKNQQTHSKFATELATLRNKQASLYAEISRASRAGGTGLALMQKEYHKISKAISEASRQQRTLSAELHRSLKAQQRLSGAMTHYDNAKNKRDELKGKMVGTVASAAVGVGVMRTYMEQEEAANNLKISMMKADGTFGQFEKIGKIADQLGQDLPGTRKDFYNLAQSLKKQGLSDEALTGGALKTSAELNVLLDMDQAAGGEFLAKFMESSRLKESELSQAADYLQRGMYAAGLNKDQMYEAMKYYAPKVNDMKLTGLENTKKIIAIEGIAGQQGIEGSTFGTGFNEMLNRMASGPEKLKNATKGMTAEAKEMMKSAGVQFDFWDKKGNFKGLDAMVVELEKLEKIRAKYGDKGVAIVTEQLFETQGGRVASILAQKGKKGLDEMLQKMDQQASLQDRINQKTATLGSALESLGGAWDSAIGSLGSIFAEDIKTFAKSIQEVIEKYSPFIQKHKEAIKFIGGLVAGFIALRGVLQIGAFAVQTVTMAMNALKIATMTNPIGLLIGAIAVGAYLIYENWASISTFFSDLWADVSNSFRSSWDWIKSVWSNVTGWVANAWSGVTNFFSGLWTEITTAFDGGILGVGKLILNWSPIGLFHQTFAAVMSWFGIDVPKSFTDFGAAMIDSLINGIKSAWESVKGFVTSIGDSIKNAFSFDGKS